ncbi:uncharacterized protein LOC100177943 [Ciona intestinalis]
MESVGSSTPSSIQNIIKKAKEARIKEKRGNYSGDSSLLMLRKKRKSKSQSFVMRHASALVEKNKTLALMLVQTKNLNRKLETSIHLLQRNQMDMMVRMNSYRVENEALRGKLEATQDKLDGQASTFDKFVEDFMTMAEATREKIILEDTIELSQPELEQTNINKPTSAVAAKVVKDKWKPNLESIKSPDEIDPDTDPGMLESPQPPHLHQDQQDVESPMFEHSNLLDTTEEAEDSFFLGISPTCKNRRSSILTSDPPILQMLSLDEEPSAAEVKKRKTISTVHFADEEQLSVISMELTNPIMAEIELGKPEDQPQKKFKKDLKSVKRKPRKSVKSKKPVKKNEDKYADISADSFLVDSNKKIELGTSARKRAMEDITNIQDGIRPRRRRTTPVSYKEPKLTTKLRQGDKFTDATLYKAMK